MPPYWWRMNVYLFPRNLWLVCSENIPEYAYARKYMLVLLGSYKVEKSFGRSVLWSATLNRVTKSKVISQIVQRMDQRISMKLNLTYKLMKWKLSTHSGTELRFSPLRSPISRSTWLSFPVTQSRVWRLRTCKRLYTKGHAWWWMQTAQRDPAHSLLSPPCLQGRKFGVTGTPRKGSRRTFCCTLNTISL